MTRRAPTIEPLLRTLYSAPGSANGWTRFLEQLRLAFGGAAANLMVHHTQPRASSFTANAGSGPEGLALYSKHWCRRDGLALAASQTPPAARTLLPGDALAPHSNRLRTAFYANFGRSFDGVPVIAATLENDAGSTAVVSVLGHEGRPPFGAPEISALEMLVPHLQNALRLHRRLTAAAAATEALGAVYDRCGYGVLVVDSDRRCSYANAAATALLAQRDGLLLNRNELRTTEPATTRQLRELVAARVSRNQSAASSSRLLAVNRPSGRRPYSVLVSPTPPHRDPVFARDCPAAVVSIIDPDSSPRSVEGTLQSLHSLTPAEARLAALLAQGLSLYDAADRLGVTRHTARSVLKLVMSKTQTHRQAELVQLLLQTIPL